MKKASYTLGVLLAALSTLVAGADPSWPTRPIRILIAYPPGGGGDSVVRVLADPLSKTLKQPVIVENRPGASTTLAASLVAAARPDGYTLLVHTENIFGAHKVVYDFVKYDQTSFSAITSVASTFFVMGVNKDLGIKRVSELVARARENAVKPMFVALTDGALAQIIITSFNKLAGTNLVLAPYKGGAPAVLAAVAGHVPITFAVPTSVMPLAKSGQLIALAITAPKRSPLTPGLPTLAEEGLAGYNVGYWFGLVGPAKMPEDVVQKLFDATNQALEDPALQAKFAGLGYETTPAKSVAEFRAMAMRDGAALATLMQTMGIKGGD